MKINLLSIFILAFMLGCDNHISTTQTIKDSCDVYLKQAKNNQQKYDKKLFYNQKAIEILLKQKKDSLNIEKLFKVAWNYYQLNDWNNFKNINTIIFQKSKEKNNSYHIAKSYRNYGLYYEKMNLNDSCFKYYTKSEKIFKDLNNQQFLCKIIQDKAALFYKTNDYSACEISLIEALKISKIINENEEKYRIYTSLGVCSMEQREYINASIYFQKALKIAKNNLSKLPENPIAFCLNNIGVNNFLAGNIVEAIVQYETALKETHIKQESPLIYCRLIDNLAYSKFKNKIFNNLPNSYFISSGIRDSLNINEGKVDNKLYLSEYYTYIKDTLSAKKYATEAYLLSKEFRAPKDMLVCLKQLAKADPKNALKYSNEYITISDSMHQIERETRNKFAKITYETEEITLEKDTAVKQKSIFLGGMITISLIGSLLLIIKNQKSKHKDLMYAQSRQKTNDEIYHLIQNQQSKIDEGREIEKKRIARDLHDGIMNKLSSTRLNLHVLKSNSDKQTVTNCLPYIDSIHDIEKEIRNIAHDLNNEVFLENDSFQRMLTSLFEEQQKITKAKIHIDIESKINWDLVKSVKKVNIYRILQEAFHNAEKYSKAENIFVGISQHKDFILVEMHDDGIGFSIKNKTTGIGMQNIKSRAKDCGGLFHVDSKKDTGTTIIVSIPTANI